MVGIDGMNLEARSAVPDGACRSFQVLTMEPDLCLGGTVL